jgi:prephenate dehydratase
VRGGDGTLAAIASQAAARLYGLEILESSVQEDSRNATSFWVIARPEEAATPERATRLVVLLDAPAGSDTLSAMVASLYRTGFEVVFVSSLPLPGGIFGFRYLLSCSADEPVALEAVDSALEPADRVLRLGWFD